MNCELVREAISSRCDGEALPAELTVEAVDEHLTGCRECRTWAAGVERLTAMWRVEPAPPAPPMRAALLGMFDQVVPSASRASTRVALLRTALAVIAGLQLAMVVPALLFGHDREAPVHVAHEMGSFELAVAFGLLAVAYRPVWAAGMSWVIGAAAATLVATALSDLAGGATNVGEEAPHLLVIIAAALLIALARGQEPPSGVKGRRLRIPLPMFRGQRLSLGPETTSEVRSSRWEADLSPSRTDGWRPHRAA